jgi:hypothetical protein
MSRVWYVESLAVVSRSLCRNHFSQTELHSLKSVMFFELSLVEIVAYVALLSFAGFFCAFLRRDVVHKEQIHKRALELKAQRKAEQQQQQQQSQEASSSPTAKEEPASKPTVQAPRGLKRGFLLSADEARKKTPVAAAASPPAGESVTTKQQQEQEEQMPLHQQQPEPADAVSCSAPAKAAPEAPPCDPDALLESAWDDWHTQENAVEDALFTVEQKLYAEAKASAKAKPAPKAKAIARK